MQQRIEIVIGTNVSLIQGEVAGMPMHTPFAKKMLDLPEMDKVHIVRTLDSMSCLTSGLMDPDKPQSMNNPRTWVRNFDPRDSSEEYGLCHQHQCIWTKNQSSCVLFLASIGNQFSDY